MKNLSYLTFTAISFLSVFAHSTAYAENRAGAATFTIGGGYEMFSSLRHIQNTGVATGSLGYNFTKNWGAEAFLGAFRTNSKYSTDTRNVDGTLLAFDVLYYFYPSKSINPYLLAGPGLSSINPNGSDAHTEGNVNAGAGLEMFVDKSVAFRVDARDFYTITSTKNDVVINAGISFLLDLC